MQKFFYISMMGMLACSENKLNGLDDANAGGGMAIEVTPLALDFGIVGSEDAATVRAFTISSVGTEDAIISGIEIQGDDATSFTLVIPFMQDTILSPDESVNIQVAFDPDGSYSLNAEAVVFSDDPSQEAIPVRLTGEGAIPDLVISPDPLNFGVTYVGCEMDNQVTLTNVGSETLDVYNILNTEGAFTINNPPAFPFELASEEEYVLDITFVPEFEGVYSGGLEVISTDPNGNEFADFSGNGQYVASYEQYWENPVDPPTDIMFSVDQSCSMGDDNALLASSFSSFISQLNNYSTDWQIMIANADSGCNNGGIYTPSTPNYISNFQSQIQVGGAGSYTENLLTIVRNAVENTDSGECNAGFLRANAMLHIIMVSDEREQSIGSYSTFVNEIIAKKGGVPENVRMSVIYNPNDSLSRYTGAANDTGGLIFDIRSSAWSTPLNLELLAEASVISDRYALDNLALEHTIEVFINGYAVQSNWHYDSVANAVVFDASPPSEGDNITINYATPAVCE